MFMLLKYNFISGYPKGKARSADNSPPLSDCHIFRGWLAHVVPVEGTKRVYGHELGLWHGKYFTKVQTKYYINACFLCLDLGHRICAGQSYRTNRRLFACHVPLSR